MTTSYVYREVYLACVPFFLGTRYTQFRPELRATPGKHIPRPLDTPWVEACALKASASTQN